MSAASVVRGYAEQAAEDAELTGRRDSKIAARELEKLAARLQREADMARARQAKRRAKQGGDDGGELALSRAADRDKASSGETWQCAKRTPRSVLLRRTS